MQAVAKAVLSATAGASLDALPDAPPALMPDAPNGEAELHAGQPPVSEAFYKRGTFNREASVGYMMRRIVGIMTHQVDKRLESHGLTHAQWTPLFLINQGRASTLAELSRDLQVDAGALTRTLDRLEAKGLCRRERSTEDRRVVNLSLTPQGEVATAPVPAVLCGVSNSLLEGFTHEEWQTLMLLLRRMMANAEQMNKAGEPDDDKP
jgi:DNA-binding MarR family transcriptional regulator